MMHRFIVVIFCFVRYLLLHTRDHYHRVTAAATGDLHPVMHCRQSLPCYIGNTCIQVQRKNTLCYFKYPFQQISYFSKAAIPRIRRSIHGWPCQRVPPCLRLPSLPRGDIFLPSAFSKLEICSKYLQQLGVSVTGFLPAKGSSLHTFLTSALWMTVFTTTAAFNAAEKAIDSLYPWKIREFVEKEGENGPFSKLSKNMLNAQFAILLSTTACSVISANLFSVVMLKLFGTSISSYSSLILTILTIFFAEVVPRAFGVDQPVRIATLTIHLINTTAQILRPISSFFAYISTLLLKIVGIDPNQEGK
ncbi:hypothetical protein IE077_003409, partial [Cardiosporidium cionae]